MAKGEAEGIPCYLCHKPINYELTRVLPLHSQAGTTHHIIGLAQGGNPVDPANLVPAHRGCNTREGNRIRGLQRRALGVGTSRLW